MRWLRRRAFRPRVAKRCKWCGSRITFLTKGPLVGWVNGKGGRLCPALDYEGEHQPEA